MKNFSFKAKLLALCALSASITLTVAAISYKGLHDVEASYDQVADVAMPNLNALNDMYLAFREVRINLRTLGLPELSKDEAHIYIENVKAEIARYESLDAAYEAVPSPEGEKPYHDKVNEAWAAFKVVGGRALAAYAANTSASHAELAKIFLHDCPVAAADFKKAMDGLKAFHIEKAKIYTADARSEGTHTNQMVLLVSVLGLIVGVSVGLVFANKMTTSILGIARALEASAEDVSSASTHIAQASSSLSEAATEQASSLQQTTASLEEITAMIGKASEGAEAAATSSAGSHEKAQQGQEAVQNMMVSMDDISQSNAAILRQVNESNAQMREVVQVIQDIGARTKVINEIVFQTKILSFNASVEAARAGDQGKGFAVVAEEVGNLAQMSGNAAREITDMLAASIQKVEVLVANSQRQVESLIQEGKTKVDAGVQIAQQCAEVLNEIVSNASQVSSLSQEISQASREQTQGVGEINKAMSQLDAVTQQNASASEQAANTAGELSEQAKSLKMSVEQLMNAIQGGHAPASSPMPVPLPVSRSLRGEERGQQWAA